MMLKNQHGFTLLELLVAAVIIGALAVFATQSFRSSASDIRIQNAKAKAKVVAMAARIFNDDYKNASFTSANLANPEDLREETDGTEKCSPSGSVTLQTLVNCGYLEQREYLDKDFVYNFNTSTPCSPDNVCVCMHKADRGSRVIAETTDEYCTDGESALKEDF